MTQTERSAIEGVAPAEEVKPAYVRKTVEGVTTLAVSSYGSLKEWSSFTKNIAEAAEGKLSWVAEPMTKYYAKVEPMIDMADEGVDSLITRAGDIKSRTVEKAQQAKELRQELSAKAVERLSKSFDQVKEFSATRSKEIIHIDLIEYASEVLDNANNIAKPTYLAVQEKLSIAIENVNSSVSALQDAMAEQGLTRAELQEKLNLAILRVRELSKTGQQYVTDNFEVLSAFTKQKTNELQSTAQSALDASVTYVLKSPELLHDYNKLLLEKTGLDAEKGLEDLRKRAGPLIEQANQLLVSITQVIRGVVHREHEHQE